MRGTGFLPQSKHHLLWGHQLLYKAWEEDTACEDCERLEKNAQFVFTYLSSIISNTSKRSLMFSFPFQSSLVTHPDFVLLTMKTTVIAVFFGKYSWCAIISSSWVCVFLPWLISVRWLLLFPSDSMADEALSHSRWSKPWHNFSEIGHPNFLTLT